MDFKIFLLPLLLFQAAEREAGDTSRFLRAVMAVAEVSGRFNLLSFSKNVNAGENVVVMILLVGFSGNLHLLVLVKCSDLYNFK